MRQLYTTYIDFIVWKITRQHWSASSKYDAVSRTHLQANMIYALWWCAIYHWGESQTQLQCSAVRWRLASDILINCISILIKTTLILSEENVSGACKCKTSCRWLPGCCQWCRVLSVVARMLSCCCQDVWSSLDFSKML